MIQVLDVDGGCSLYQNKNHERISLDIFKKLLKFLKSLFNYELDATKYGNVQPAYVFFTSRTNLEYAIDTFLNSNEGIEA